MKRCQSQSQSRTWRNFHQVPSLALFGVVHFPFLVSLLCFVSSIRTSQSPLVPTSTRFNIRSSCYRVVPRLASPRLVASLTSPRSSVALRLFISRVPPSRQSHSLVWYVVWYVVSSVPSSDVVCFLVVSFSPRLLTLSFPSSRHPRLVAINPWRSSSRSPVAFPHLVRRLFSHRLAASRLASHPEIRFVSFLSPLLVPRLIPRSDPIFTDHRRPKFQSTSRIWVSVIVGDGACGKVVSLISSVRCPSFHLVPVSSLAVVSSFAALSIVSSTSRLLSCLLSHLSSRFSPCSLSCSSPCSFLVSFVRLLVCWPLVCFSLSCPVSLFVVSFLRLVCLPSPHFVPSRLVLARLGSSPGPSSHTLSPCRNLVLPFLFFFSSQSCMYC
jgi:hypothetical protein